MLTSTNMDIILQKIISRQTLPIERVEAYQTILRVLQEERVMPVTLIPHSETILSSLKEDISNSNLQVSQEALHLLGVFLFTERIVSSVEESKLMDILDELCSLITSSTEKTVCTRALWCLTKQKLPSRIYMEKIDQILQAIEYVLTGTTHQSFTMELEAIKVINRHLGDTPELMVPRIKVWGRRLYMGTVHPSSKVRETSFVALEAAQTIFQQHHSEILAVLIPDLKQTMVSAMMKLFKERHELYVLRLWNLFLDILGKALHQGASLINILLGIVEKAFKSTVPDIKVAAFKSWQQLINNFGSELDVLANPKRLRLVMQPLKANNAKTEEIAVTKFRIWWHLCICLGPKLSLNFEQVLCPFLQFCFGSADSTTNGTSSCATTPVTSTLKQVGSSSPSGLNQKFPGMHRIASESLAQILGLGMAIKAVSQPSFSIKALLHPVITTEAIFMKYARILILASADAISGLGSEKKDLHLQLYIWHSVVSHVKAMSELENKKELTDTVSTFLKVTEEFVKSQTPPPDVILKLLEASTFLPPRILNSSSFSLDNSSVMQGTPALFLISLLLNPCLSKLSTTQERFMVVFQKLVNSGLGSMVAPLNFVESVQRTLENTIQEIQNADTVFRLWSIIANPLQEYIQKTQEVNQGDALEHDFSCLHSVLLFPVKHIFTKQVAQGTMKTLMRIWSELFKTFARCAALVVNAEANICCEEFLSKLLVILKGNTFDDTLFQENILQILSTIVQCLEYQNSQVNPTTTMPLSPTKWMKRKQKPLGNITSLIQVISFLITKILSIPTEKKEVSSNDTSRGTFISTLCSLLDVLKQMFSNMNSSLIGNAVIKLVKPLTPLFENPSKYPISKAHLNQFFIKLEAMWNSLVTSLQDHYTGSFDSEFLGIISPLLENTLTYPRKAIRLKSRMLWQSKFAPSYETLIYPESLKNVLKKHSPPLIPGVSEELNEAGEGLISINDEDESQLLNKSVEESSPYKVGSFLHCIINPQKSESTPTKEIIKTSEKQGIEDINENEFIKIPPVPKRRCPLTEHQKEILQTTKSMPAMYMDLSQDSAQILGSQFSDDTQASQSKIEDVQTKISMANEILEEDKSKEEPQQQITESIADSCIIISEEPENKSDSVEQELQTDIISDYEQTEDVDSRTTIDDPKVKESEVDQSKVEVDSVIIISGTENDVSIESSKDSFVKPIDNNNEILTTESEAVVLISTTDPKVIEVDEPVEVVISTEETQEVHTLINENKNDSEVQEIMEENSVEKSAVTSIVQEQTKKLVEINHSETDVKIPNAVQDDEKLRSKPVLEIKRLTNQEIVNLSQPTSESESELEKNKVKETGVSEIKKGEKLSPKNAVKYVSRKHDTDVTNVSVIQSCEANIDIIPSSQSSDSSEQTDSSKVQQRIETQKKRKRRRNELDFLEIDSEQSKRFKNNTSDENLEKTENLDKNASLRLHSKRRSKSSSEVKLGIDSHEKKDSESLQSSNKESSLIPSEKDVTEHHTPKKDSYSKKGNVLETSPEKRLGKNSARLTSKSVNVANTVVNRQTLKGVVGCSFEKAKESSEDVVNRDSALDNSNSQTKRKIKTARKSVNSSSVSLSSSSESQRTSKRLVKKSLKARLAEESSSLKRKVRRQSVSPLSSPPHSEESMLEEISEQKPKENFESLPWENSDSTLSMIDSVEIENVQVPSSNIDLLSHNSVISCEQQIESVPWIVADTVEVTTAKKRPGRKPKRSRGGSSSGSSPSKISTSDTNKSTELLISADNQIFPVESNSDTSIQIQEYEVQTSSEPEELNEIVEMDKTTDRTEDKHENATSDAKLEISVHEKCNLDYSSEDSEAIVPPNSEINDIVVESEQIVDNTIETCNVISDDMVQDENAENIQNKQENTDTTSLTEKDKNDEKFNELLNAYDEGKGSGKTNNASSVFEDESSVTDDTSSPVKTYSKEEEPFSFIALKNPKTYSSRSRSSGKLSSLESSPQSKSVKMSPLLQQISVRAAKMVEAATKKNLSTYEKFKYEQAYSKKSPPSQSPVKESELEVAESLSSASMLLAKNAISSGSKENCANPPIVRESPVASPTTSILKKRKLNEEDQISSPSPPCKQRHVSFADPPVQAQVEYPPWGGSRSMRSVNRCLEMNKAVQKLRPTSVHSSVPSTQQNESNLQQLENKTINETESLSSFEAEKESQLDDQQPINKDLVNCEDSIENIVFLLTSPMWVKGLGELLKKRNIATIGQLSALSELEVNSLPIKSPKIDTLKQVLNDYTERIKKSLTEESIPVLEDEQKDEEKANIENMEIDNMEENNDKETVIVSEVIEEKTDEMLFEKSVDQPEEKQKTEDVGIVVTSQQIVFEVAEAIPSVISEVPLSDIKMPTCAVDVLTSDTSVYVSDTQTTSEFLCQEPENIVEVTIGSLQQEVINDGNNLTKDVIMTDMEGELESCVTPENTVCSVSENIQMASVSVDVQDKQKEQSEIQLAENLEQVKLLSSPVSQNEEMPVSSSENISLTTDILNKDNIENSCVIYSSDVDAMTSYNVSILKPVDKQSELTEDISGICKEFSETAEIETAELRRRTPDLLITIKELHSHFSIENLKQLSFAEIIELQEQLCNMTLATVTALKQISRDISSEK